MFDIREKTTVRVTVTCSIKQNDLTVHFFHLDVRDVVLWRSVDMQHSDGADTEAV